jgi:hypothetical protein
MVVSNLGIVKVRHTTRVPHGSLDYSNNRERDLLCYWLELGGEQDLAMLPLFTAASLSVGRV